MDDPTRLELLQAEYFKLQDHVETFDERALQIKTWSVTVSLAGVVAAYGSDSISLSDRSVILWVAAASAASFWLIEFLWKCFQWSFLPRIEAIETEMRRISPAGTLAPLQIRAYWHGTFKGPRAKTAPDPATTLTPPHHAHGEIASSLRRGKFFTPPVALPHLPIALLAAGLAVFG
ncbi:hypothetical protein ACFB49_14650 [Sphingomonas sp. DBB INV C78]|uniref:hypothetical protein n=1 Tax=Sphingomonas sp. DBB INV C78 TaxID=3349434 RepID=UPI0036D29260